MGPQTRGGLKAQARRNARLHQPRGGSPQRLNPAGWHRYVPIVAAVAVIVIALAALGYAGGGANLDAMFKSPELAHVGTEVVEGAQAQTSVAPQRGIVAAASTIADVQKDEDKQGDDVDANQTSETAITPSAG